MNEPMTKDEIKEKRDKLYLQEDGMEMCYVVDAINTLFDILERQAPVLHECWSCKSIIPDGNKFCEVCGRPVWPIEIKEHTCTLPICNICEQRK